MSTSDSHPLSISHSISVIIPVYNSESTLPELVKRLQAVLSASAREYELLLVNDGSRRPSWSVIQQLAAEYPWVRGLDLMRNYGQHNALLCGLRAARFETLVTLDDDLQNPPEELPKLLAKFNEGHDVVYGSAPSGRQSLWRELASWLIRWVLRRTMHLPAARDASSFRVIRAPVCRAFTNYNSPFVSIDVLLSWGTSRFAAVPVAREPRRSGSSNYTFFQLVSFALTTLTGFSIWPLRLASIVGFGFTLFGLLVLAFILGSFFLQGRSVPGFPFLASVIAIFSGAQLFALGIIGEYLARMHFRMMERPPYVVRKEI